MRFQIDLIRFITAFLILSYVFLLSSCGEDDGGSPGDDLTGETQTYVLNEVGNSGISGTAVFAELTDGSTRITVDLDGTVAGDSHPAHIHANSAAEGGSILIDIEPIDGETGGSVTYVTAQNDGTPVSYDDLIAYDGYINVHNSESDLGTLLAQGDIGQNVLTGESESYELLSVSNPEIHGEAFFYERMNGETLIQIVLEGDLTDSDHPAHIHMNTAAEGGSILIDLSNVRSGFSRTNVSAMNNGDPVTYEQLEDFDGYINVHESPSNLGTLVAQGDIGQNKLESDLVEYPLSSKSDPDISGTATFYKRRNNETLVVLSLLGTEAGNSHPAHIHMNSAAEGGAIAINLTNVNGETGLSKTNITQFNSGTAITYDELLTYDGYINVHLSDADLGTLVAQGNIGSNVN